MCSVRPPTHLAVLVGASMLLTECGGSVADADEPDGEGSARSAAISAESLPRAATATPSA